MALTAAGAALTEAHRVAQVGIASAASLSAMETAKLLDPLNLDATAERWATQQLLALDVFQGQAAAGEATYLAAYDQAELTAASRLTGQTRQPLTIAKRGAFNVTAEREAIAWVVPMIKKLTGQGLTPQEALQRVTIAAANHAWAGAMRSSRRVFVDTARRNRRHYRVVCDARPCTWCAMLATRGPVYYSEQTARANTWHDHCGCTYEMADWPWQPTAREKAWIDAYETAAGKVGTRAEDVTEAMRQQPGAGGLFSNARVPATGGGAGGGTRPPLPPILMGGAADDWPWWLDPVSQERWDHIIDEHGPNSTSGKPRFKRDTDIGRAIFDTITGMTTTYDKSDGKIKRRIVNGQEIVVIMRPTDVKGRFFLITACPDE